MEDKKPAKHNVAVPPLQDKDSDFNLWYERTKLKLDAKGLWEDFCVQQETVPDATTNKDAHDKHMQRRKLARWKIEKSLSPEISKMVQNEDTPYGVLIRLRKIFVGATKLSLVHQLHSVMEMKYKKGANLLMFIEQLKEGFTKLENMGLPLQESLKPYIW